jgi:hypothetical protein
MEPRILIVIVSIIVRQSFIAIDIVVALGGFVGLQQTPREVLYTSQVFCLEALECGTEPDMKSYGDGIGFTNEDSLSYQPARPVRSRRAVVPK